MPAKGAHVTTVDETASWGIEPVPDRLRKLGLVDTGLLWGNLGVSLLVLVAGTYLVPALSLREAFLAILLGSLIGNGMLGLAALIGADGRVPAMVLMRAPLGQRGSWVPTALNVLQCLGWAVFELIIIAYAAAALSEELLGWEGRWLWTLVFGAVAAALALADGGARVIAAGLDQDFRRLPFGPMPELLAHAEFVDKLQAVCHRCGGGATTTQRLVDGRPAPYSGETIVVGANEQYEARCRDCHEAGEGLATAAA